MAALKIILILAVCWVINTKFVVCHQTKLSTMQIAAVKAGVEEYALKEHNRLRSLHKVQPLRLSANISAKAKAYAQVLADKDIFEHSDYAKTGAFSENLCLTSHNPEQCTQIWYDEIKYYDFDNPKYSDKVGHFTALIWASSRELGYGQAKSKKGYYVVALYYPTGNELSSFATEVPRIGGGPGGPRSTTPKSMSSKITLSVNVLIISICFGLFKLAYGRY